MVVLEAINKDHLKGAAVGVGVCAVGYYIYKKNPMFTTVFIGSSTTAQFSPGAMVTPRGYEAKR